MSAARRRVLLVLPAALGVLPVFLSAYSSGPPVRRTGAPGDRTCLDASCHVGTRLDDSIGVQVDTGSEGPTYFPGGPRQRWVIRIRDSSARAFGLQLSVRSADDPARKPAGRMEAPEAGTAVICEDERPIDPVAGCPAASPLQFFHHTVPRSSGEFALDWTPPAAGMDDLLIYVAANASVSGQRNSRIHLRTFRLKPAPAAAVLADSAGGLARFAPGSWVSIFGAALSPTARAWSAGDFKDGLLPTALDGVEVQIDGRAAVIAYVSPSQINAQAPDGPGEGPVRFEVRNGGQLTAAGDALRQSVAPALFESQDRLALVARPDGSNGPVRSGERVVLYGSGFGETVPPAPMGRLIPSPLPLAAPVSFRIGQQLAIVEWAGLTAPGLYQFNLVLPRLDPGDYPVVAGTRGVQSQPGLLLRIASPLQ